jgi:hypothetical protein
MPNEVMQYPRLTTEEQYMHAEPAVVFHDANVWSLICANSLFQVQLAKRIQLWTHIQVDIQNCYMFPP